MNYTCSKSLILHNHKQNTCFFLENDNFADICKQISCKNAGSSVWTLNFNYLSTNKVVDRQYLPFKYYE